MMKWFEKDNITVMFKDCSVPTRYMRAWFYVPEFMAAVKEKYDNGEKIDDAVLLDLMRGLFKQAYQSRTQEGNKINKGISHREYAIAIKFLQHDSKRSSFKNWEWLNDDN